MLCTKFLSQQISGPECLGFMNDISLIYPHQLFVESSHLQKGRKVVMVEESLFFHQLPFHKSKLILHRASMKCYQAGLESKGYEVIYIEAGDERANTGALLAWC